MSLIKLGPIHGLDAVEKLGGNADRLFYPSPYYMRLAKDAPVLVDHDTDRPVGRVKELFRFEDTDGPWLTALVDIDRPPGWLKRGTRASFEYVTTARSSIARVACHRGYVREVSILSPGVEPCEPRAQVCHLSPPGGEVKRSPVRRAAVAATRLYDPHLEEQIAARYREDPTILIRPGIGRVLGVR